MDDVFDSYFAVITISPARTYTIALPDIVRDKLFPVQDQNKAVEFHEKSLPLK
jgi:hypothetical protein